MNPYVEVIAVVVIVIGISLYRYWRTRAELRRRTEARRIEMEKFKKEYG